MPILGQPPSPSGYAQQVSMGGENAQRAVERAKEMIDMEIANNISQTSQGIQEVNENVNQSSLVSAEITKDITVVNQSASEIASNSDQVMLSAEELKRMASELNTIVAGFKV